MRRLYRKDLGHFEIYLACNSIKDASNISKVTVLDYLKTLNGKAHPTKAYCNQITRIIKYLHYLEEEGIIFLSPVRDYSIPKHQTKNYTVIGKVEMKKMHRILIGHIILISWFSSLFLPNTIDLFENGAT